MNKSKIPLSAIGADHALEQENCQMKVHGGITGIGSNQEAQDQYFLIASEINEIIEEFQCNLQLNFDDNKRQEHYQLIGSTYSRVQQKLKS